MQVPSPEMTKKILFVLFGTLLLTPGVSFAQVTEADSIAMSGLITDFKEAITQKDSVRFNRLFFSTSVDFTGIMSQKTEWSIKKDYPDFQGVAVSNHKKFINEICKAPGEQEEKFYNISLSSDGAIGAISFDYAFYSGEKMIQWGNEKWNLAKDGKNWLITDVVYSIHFPDIESFPFD
jgi:hypothetical protein